ncbi:GH15 family glucan-1,4-alpha-glucosidase [Methylopila capsulata]|uniref:GH15 family glucan-1,4-alpha-glucosidase n=1 Tax=Methylopila capsulata TaxID=61654 RepID=A0A9W6ITA6_9HYPH|nr:hypothetical protein [Methylopila capsulata]MBM7850836.1 GH15 family glucan-1,4-alpha-glucosidase [Methylopila capsulata]GLK56131.1 hypothetical protein GCM10008170_21500 [Methylopila capsulata]
MIVAFIPLEELWDDHGTFGTRERHLKATEIRGLLKAGPMRFVEAEIGAALRWTEQAGCFALWRSVQDHIADPEGFSLDDFADGRALVASQWAGRDGERLILFEVHH